MWRNGAIERIPHVHRALDICHVLKIPDLEVKLEDSGFLSQSFMGEMSINEESCVLEHVVSTACSGHFGSPPGTGGGRGHAGRASRRLRLVIKTGDTSPCCPEDDARSTGYWLFVEKSLCSRKPPYRVL